MLPETITEETKKLLPKIYDDAFSPAMKQIGKAIENSVKVGRFLLAPIDYGATLYDRFTKYLEQISQRVKPENLIEGQPQIVIPTIEGLSLSIENTLLSELFLNLLTNSIDRSKQDLNHPSFPNIIKQISHDEAVILYYHKKNNYIIKHEMRLSENTLGAHLKRYKVYDEFNLNYLNYPKHFELYIEHLISLNLIEYKTIATDKVREFISEKSLRELDVIISERTFSGLGRIFVDACVPNEFKGI